MRNIFLRKILLVSIFGLATVSFSCAQVFTTLAKFNGTNGSRPVYGPLLQGTDGNFWGTASFGGANNSGTIFKITPAGKLTTVYSFCSVMNSHGACTDGTVPVAGLMEAGEGYFLGVTTEGGTHDEGVAFVLTPAEKLIVLHTYCSQENAQSKCFDGSGPIYPLLEGTDGNFYGVTSQELSGADAAFFNITPTGVYTTIASAPEGTGIASLSQAINGDFYGIGENGTFGTFLAITIPYEQTTLFTFDQNEPSGYVTQGSDGNFYGASQEYGAYDEGLFFQLTLAGNYTPLYSFCQQANCADGAMPNPLIQGTDGNFYGTTEFGGVNASNGPFQGYGTIFQITPQGNLKTIYTFCSQIEDCPDGSYPRSTLTQGTDGNFYGTTYGAPGCPGNCGTIFRLSMGLAPFVKAFPNFGQPGATVTILGSNLEGATSITFNGTSATFKVISGSYIQAQVPISATSGTIAVTTKSGTLSSNVPFQVEP